MPNCYNCGAHVTEDYVRVFSDEGLDYVKCCPECPDLTRHGAVAKERKDKGPRGPNVD